MSNGLNIRRMTNRMRNLSLITLCLVAVLAWSGVAIAQQATGDIWKLVPPNSLFVAAFDGSPNNPTVQVISRTQDPATREALAKQHAALRKAVEDFATLFGVSLDFAKDIDSWVSQQWAFVLVPDEKTDVQPVFIMASKDAAAANAALAKLLEPWQRVAEIVPQPDQDFPITGISAKGAGLKVYVSAFGPVLAISPEKAALKAGLKGGGFAAGSTGDKVVTALSGSIFYAFADPALLNLVHVKPETIPLTGFGLGVSAIETGAKVRVLGFPTEQGAQMLGMMLPAQQTGTMTANQGIPSASLAVVSLPNLAPASMLAAMMGASKDPILGGALEAAKPVLDLPASGAVTAVLPKPAWMLSGMAESAEDAAARVEQVKAKLRELKAETWDVAPGITAVGIPGPKGSALYLAQSGQYVYLASDVQAARQAVATAEGKQPSIVSSATYKETIAGLEGSNVLTIYGSLAPVRGLGYLIDGLGFGQLTPIHSALAKGLQNTHSIGIGAGFDGQMASITFFIRAEPKIGTTIGPAAVAGTAIGAAVLFPVFARAREAARISECMSNMKQLAMAAHMYAADHNDKLPDRLNWRAQLKDYLPKPIEEMQCPFGESTYAFNKNLGGINVAKIDDPAGTILFFEGECDLPNATGSRTDAILPHQGIGCFAYADGHVQRLGDVPSQPHWVPYVVKQPAKKAPAKKPVH